MKKTLLILFFVLLSFGLVLPHSEVLAATCGTLNKDLQTLGASNSNLPGFFSSYQYCNTGSVVTKVANTLFAFAGTISLLFVIVGGYQYMTAGGDAERATRGKRTMTWSAIGLAVIVMSGVIINLATSLILGGSGNNQPLDGTTGGTGSNLRSSTGSEGGTSNSNTGRNTGSNSSSTGNNSARGSGSGGADEESGGTKTSPEIASAIKATSFAYEIYVTTNNGRRTNNLRVIVNATPRSLYAFCGAGSTVFPVQIDVGAKPYKSNFNISALELGKLDESVATKFTFPLISELPATFKVNVCGTDLTNGPKEVD